MVPTNHIRCRGFITTLRYLPFTAAGPYCGVLCRCRHYRARATVHISLPSFFLCADNVLIFVVGCSFTCCLL